MKKAPMDWTDAEAEQVLASVLGVVYSDMRKAAEADIRGLLARATMLAQAVRPEARGISQDLKALMQDMDEAVLDTDASGRPVAHLCDAWLRLMAGIRAELGPQPRSEQEKP